MKKLDALLLITFILGCYSTVIGQKTEQTAVIIDQSGMSTELKNIKISEQADKYYKYFNDLIITEMMDVVIPCTHLIAIESSGEGVENKGKFEVSYKWLGEKKRVSGNLADLKFSGQSDFGNFSISSQDVKQMTFSQASDKATQKEKFTPKGYLTLKDGTNLEFGDLSVGKYGEKYTLKRHVYYSHKYKKFLPQSGMDMAMQQRRYEWAWKVQSAYDDDISFKRGESQGNAKFKDLKSIAFEGTDYRDIILRLKNGKSTKARIIKSRDNGDFDGLIGVSDKGEFYIERENIRLINFY